jgi:cell division protein FtsL
MANKLIIEPDEQQQQPQDKQTPAFARALRKVADFDINISGEWLAKQIPFGLFVVLLAVLHIWNAHYTERLVRKTDKLQKETKELRSEYITIFSALMSESKQSSVAEKLDTIGIKELRTPPVKIIVSE